MSSGQELIGAVARAVSPSTTNAGEDTHEHKAASRAASRAIDGTLHAISDDIERATKPSSATATDGERRSALISQIHSIRGFAVRAVQRGVDEGLALIATPEKERASSAGALLEIAAALVIAGAAGPIALKVAKGIASAYRKKAAEDAVKEVLKSGLKKAVAGSDDSNPPDYAAAFRTKLGRQILQADLRMVAQQASVENALTALTTAQLEELATSLLSRFQQLDDEVTQIANATVVAWTNFLARAKHGAMPAWNLWEPNGGRGAVRLEGAVEPRSARDAGELTGSNVAPSAFRTLAIPKSDGDTGILEIAIDFSGRIVSLPLPVRGLEGAPGLGMRLTNVGPAVRERIKTLGLVRDVPINKMVRVYDPSNLSDGHVCSIMITADGYVRGYELGGASRVHPNEAPHSITDNVKRQVGITPVQFRENKEANAALVRDLAEHAQTLPLTSLET